MKGFSCLSLPGSELVCRASQNDLGEGARSRLCGNICAVGRVFSGDGERLAAAVSALGGASRWYFFLCSPALEILIPGVAPC